MLDGLSVFFSSLKEEEKKHLEKKGSYLPFHQVFKGSSFPFRKKTRLNLCETTLSQTWSSKEDRNLRSKIR